MSLYGVAMLGLCFTCVARELDNLNEKLEVLKSIFETASGVSFKSTTLQRKSVSEVRSMNYLKFVFYCTMKTLPLKLFIHLADP